MQALRGVAAVAVVLSHAARHLDKAVGAPGLTTLFQAGHAGVDLFFVISGFIILFVHHRDIGRPGRLSHYLGRRFDRVMPLYWVALLLTVGMGAAGGHGVPPWTVLAWSASLLPSVSEPLLGIAWTLQFEVVFYSAFAVLILDRRLGVALLTLWFAWIAVTALGFGSDKVPSALCGIYSLEFLMGMIAARSVLSCRVHRPRIVAVSGLVLFVTMMVLESMAVTDGYGASARLVYGPAAALVIAGLAAAEQANQINVPSWLQVLGGASYSIYLFQFVFIGAVWQGSLRLGLSHTLCFVALASAAIAGGVAMSILVEKPLLSLRRRQESTSFLKKKKQKTFIY